MGLESVPLNQDVLAEYLIANGILNKLHVADTKTYMERHGGPFAQSAVELGYLYPQTVEMVSSYLKLMRTVEMVNIRLSVPLQPSAYDMNRGSTQPDEDVTALKPFTPKLSDNVRN